MSTKAAAARFMIVVMAVALLAVSREAEAQTCDPTSLGSCSATIFFGTTPSNACCTAVKAQSPTCLCQYSKDPTYSQYVNSPNAMKIATTCNVTFQC